VTNEIEACEVCGFEWDAIDPLVVPQRVIAATETFADLLRGDSGETVLRPNPDRWSAVEYGCHVRDALTNVRDRMILGLVEDMPVPPMMYGAKRVELGLYAADIPEVLASDLVGAGALFARTLDAVSADALDRTIFYGWPTPGYRTLRWVAAQALHESEHHLSDAQENIVELRHGTA
jgi:hypothetical protein